MDLSVFALAFVGFVGGLMVTSRTLAWLVGLHRALRPPSTAASGTSARSRPFQLLLHSGPWLLVVAGGVVRYVASLKRPELLWALTGGFVAAAVFIGAMRRRAPSKPRPALTPRRLVQIRREFFLANIALFTIATTAFAGWDLWNTLDRDYVYLMICALFSPLSGWLYSLVMWQWYGTTLEVAVSRPPE